MELIKIQSSLKAPKNNYNSFGRYKYRSCEDILESCKKILAENKCYITLNDSIEYIGNRFYIKATASLRREDGTLIAEANAFAREEETKKGMDAAQITGAASSYARKYALCGLLAIDDNKDADALNVGDNKEENSSENNIVQITFSQMMQNLINAKSEQELKEISSFIKDMVITDDEKSKLRAVYLKRHNEFNNVGISI